MDRVIITEVIFTCPDCGRPGEMSLPDGNPAEWECDGALCHRVVLVSPDKVEAVGFWDVVHVYDAIAA
jgi:hypothetical protein